MAPRNSSGGNSLLCWTKHVSQSAADFSSSSYFISRWKPGETHGKIQYEYLLQVCAYCCVFVYNTKIIKEAKDIIYDIIEIHHV